MPGTTCSCRTKELQRKGSLTTLQIDQYHLFVFAKIHAGISLQPLSTPTAEFSYHHVYTMSHLLHIIIMKSLCTEFNIIIFCVGPFYAL